MKTYRFLALYLNLHVSGGSIIVDGQPPPQDAQEEMWLVWSSGTVYSTFRFDTESPARRRAGGNLGVTNKSSQTPTYHSVDPAFCHRWSISHLYETSNYHLRTKSQITSKDVPFEDYRMLSQSIKHTFTLWSWMLLSAIACRKAWDWSPRAHLWEHSRDLLMGVPPGELQWSSSFSSL